MVTDLSSVGRNSGSMIAAEEGEIALTETKRVDGRRRGLSGEHCPKPFRMCVPESEKEATGLICVYPAWPYPQDRIG